MVKINLNYSSLEIIAAWRFHYKKMISLRKNFGYSVAASLFSLASWKVIGTPLFTISFLIIAILLFFTPVFVIFILPIIIYKVNKEKYKEFRFEFDENNLAITNSSITTVYRWTQFFRVSENYYLMLIYYGENQFIILPKRCFKNVLDLAELRKILKTRKLEFLN